MNSAFTIMFLIAIIVAAALMISICIAGTVFLLEETGIPDVFIGIDEVYDWNGCYIERDTAQRYGIKTYIASVRHVIDNYNALLQKLHPVCNEAMPAF